MEFIIEPIVTEAATQLTEKLNRYTFRVSPEANKFQIKDMVEKLYGVKVLNVNTLIVRGKTNPATPRAACSAARQTAGKRLS